MTEQQIAYCTTNDGVRIAYATYGNDRAPPLVYLPEVPFQEPIWASPWGRAFLEKLARHRRLITLDPRGCGASQRDADLSHPELVNVDIATVADHLRLDRFELFGGGSGAGIVAAMYPDAHPGRVSKLVLFSPKLASSRAKSVLLVESSRGSHSIYLRGLATIVFPSGPAEVQRWLSTTWRAAVSAAGMAATAWTYDLAPILRRLTMPVLVLHRKRSQIVDPAQVRAVASLIPDARLVTLDGDAGTAYWDHEQLIETVYNFLGVEHGTEPVVLPSGMTAILFTDIADSTALTERLGDAAFRAKARDLDASLRSIIAEAGGTTIDAKTLGDGVLATFPAASQAIDGARRCLKLAAASELGLHIGLHAGDVIREEGNVFGGAVNIASRICGLSAAGEILVSDVVRGMARSSAGVAFEDRGEQEMKGVGEPVRVYAVRGSA